MGSSAGGSGAFCITMLGALDKLFVTVQEITRSARDPSSGKSAWMKLLASRIRRELRTDNHCAVYKEELSRIWPLPDKKRQAEVERFVLENDFRLSFYHSDLCAIFQKR